MTNEVATKERKDHRQFLCGPSWLENPERIEKTITCRVRQSVKYQAPSTNYQFPTTNYQQTVNGERITVNKVNFVTTLSHGSDTERLQKSHTIDGRLRQSWGIFLFGAGKSVPAGHFDLPHIGSVSNVRQPHKPHGSHMKKIKLLTAGLLAFSVAGIASAQTEIRITGSTAFRKGTVDAIERILNPGFVWGSTGGSGFGANQQIFVGVVSSSNASDPGDQVIIKCSWSGSAGGIQSLAQNLPAGQAFIIDPTGVTFGSTCTATVGTGGLAVALTAGTADAGTDSANIPSGDITESHTADAALSDAFQESTPFGYPGVTPTGFSPSPIPNITLTSTPVGIVPFEYVASSYSLDGTTTANTGTGNTGLPYTGVTNLSLLNAQELIGGGVQLSQITGSTNAIDQHVLVVNAGRDHDSGTRITLIYDNQYNQNIIFNQDTGYSESVTQYIPNGATLNGTAAPGPFGALTQFESQTAGSGVVTGVTKWPSEAVIGETRGLGQEGFFSGGTVAGVLNRAWYTHIGPTKSYYDISNLGFGDAPSVNPGPSYPYVDGATITDTIKPSQNAILFDGVYPGTALHPFGPPYVNVEQGAYSFWGVEHFLTQASLSGSVANLAAAISGQVVTQADYLGVGDLLSKMVVGISADGQQITPGLTESE
jgi:hypothetical protein